MEIELPTPNTHITIGSHAGTIGSYELALKAVTSAARVTVNTVCFINCRSEEWDYVISHLLSLPECQELTFQQCIPGDDICKQLPRLQNLKRLSLSSEWTMQSIVSYRMPGETKSPCCKTLINLPSVPSSLNEAGSLLSVETFARLLLRVNPSRLRIPLPAIQELALGNCCYSKQKRNNSPARKLTQSL